MDYREIMERCLDPDLNWAKACKLFIDWYCKGPGKDILGPVKGPEAFGRVRTAPRNKNAATGRTRPLDDVRNWYG